jgi:hypothetical protein
MYVENFCLLLTALVSLPECTFNFKGLGHEMDWSLVVRDTARRQEEVFYWGMIDQGPSILYL